MKLALVTGAGRGIGRAIALEVAARGYEVVCAARTAADLAATAAAVAEAGGRAVVHPLDVRDEAAVGALARRIADDWGGLDLLVNDAGVNVVRPLDELSLAEWNDVLATNLTAPFLLARACLALLARRRGVVVNVASVGGRPGVEKFPGFGAYVASKYGLLGLTEVLALEARTRGVRAYALCPGSVDTELLAATVPGATSRLAPAEVARAVAWLASQDAPLATTGAVVELWPPRSDRP